MFDRRQILSSLVGGAVVAALPEFPAAQPAPIVKTVLSYTTEELLAKYPYVQWVGTYSPSGGAVQRLECSWGPQYDDCDPYYLNKEGRWVFIDDLNTEQNV